MQPIEIIVIIIASLIVLFNIILFIYKKIKHIPSDECQSCAKMKSLFIKEYKKGNIK